MADRDPPQPPDPDDWFAEPTGSAPSGRARRPAAGPPVSREDDFLSDEGDWPAEEPAAAAPRGRPTVDSIGNRRLALGAVIVVALVVAGLALGGVFSGGGKKAVTTTTQLTTGTTSATTSARTTTAPTTATTPTTQTVPAPTAELKPGDTGAQVKVLQRALVQLGYKPGPVDGDYGPLTAAAVGSFQKASNLVVDGVCGPLTLKALKTALQSNG